MKVTIGNRKINSKKPSICVDIDGVIFEYEKYQKNHWGNPIKGAVEALKELQQSYHVILFTARGDAERKALVEHLKKHGMVYDELNMTKPIALFYIDDRGVRFEDWNQVNEITSTVPEYHDVKKAERKKNPIKGRANNLNMLAKCMKNNPIKHTKNAMSKLTGKRGKK